MAKSDLIKKLNINDFGPTKKQQTIIDHLGTYRFISYAKPLCQFGCTFQDVHDRIRLDKKLRQAVFSIIQEIEIDLNTKITSHLVKKYGPFCYQDIFSWCQTDGPNKYLKYDAVDRKIIEQEQKQLINTITHLSKSKKPETQSLLELSQHISLGELIHIYKLMSKRNRKEIASIYDCSANELISWMDCIALYRNCCCHNGNLIDIKIETRPVTPQSYSKYLFRMKNTETTTNRFALGCVVILHLAKTINVEKEETDALKQAILALSNDKTTLESYGFVSREGFEGAFGE